MSKTSKQRRDQRRRATKLEQRFIISVKKPLTADMIKCIGPVRPGLVDVDLKEAETAAYQKRLDDSFQNAIDDLFGPLSAKVAGSTNKEYDDNMDTRTTEDKRIDYLLHRLHCTTMNKSVDLEKEFFINDDQPPRDALELLKRIEDGKFIPPTKEQADEARRWGYAMTSFIKWRDPKHPADKDGYDKAIEKLRDVSQKTEDLIRIKPADDGLDALNKFISTKLH